MHYEIHPFQNGQASLRDLIVGENMHSSIGPWAEAQRVYIEQAELEEKLLLPEPGPLVVYDLGLGIAANSLATLEFFLSHSSRRDLVILSFESQLAGLKHALENSARFPYLDAHHSLVSRLYRDRSVAGQSPLGLNFYWKIIEGDFRENILGQASPEIIYYDLFSPKSCPELWGYRTFQLLFSSTLERRKDEKETQLITYSSSTAVRSAILLAGFYAGYGNSTHEKKETTLASTLPNRVKNPLGDRWIEHWLRSSRPLPEDFPQI